MAKKTTLAQSSTTPATRADLDALIGRGEAEPGKRINVHVPESLHRAFKTKAAAEGTTMKDLIEIWISEYVK